MNPFEKWHARRRFPWKLLIQVIKIIVVTTQVIDDIFLLLFKSFIKRLVTLRKID